jgi:hypothetical protein
VVKSVTARFSRQLADSPFVFRWAVALGGRVVRTIDVTAHRKTNGLSASCREKRAVTDFTTASGWAAAAASTARPAISPPCLPCHEVQSCGTVTVRSLSVSR